MYVFCNLIEMLVVTIEKRKVVPIIGSALCAHVRSTKPTHTAREEFIIRKGVCGPRFEHKMVKVIRASTGEDCAK